MHLSMFAGTTSKIVQIPVYDSSSQTGGQLAGLAFNSGSLVCWYNREGAAGSAIQISLLTATKGTWTTAGFVSVDSTNQPGWYELHVPNAAIAAGAKSVAIQLRGATNMVPVNILIELTATDNQDSVRGGMTALPNAAAAASGGLVVLGTNATAISFTAGMTISSTTGNALALTSSGGNGDGLAVTGNGTGAGIHLVPGATGNGLLAIGGATSGTAIKATGTAGNAIALELAGQGSAAGLSATGGATGIGITAVGGATSGSGLKATGTAGNAIALEIVGQGSAAGIQSTGGATGSAFKLVGGGTSGHGLAVTTTAGDGFNLTPTAGNAITATANGTSKHGIAATGGTGGTSDGASFIAGTGGVDFRANQTGNVTGNLSGTVTTVTTTTTATNLTNAPTAGDLTSTMKTSVENAVWDAARSSHIATGVFGQLGLGILRDNTATAGAASTITLDGAASTTADFYKGAIIAIYSGTGAGQAPRTITAYSTGRVATISPAWAVTPDATSKFLITAFDDPGFVGTDGRALISADSHTAGATVAAVTGNVGGNLVGSVGSVTGAVGSVTGAVGSVTGAVGSVTGNIGGNVTGSVASVTARVTANTDQWAGTTIPAPAVTGVPKVDLVDIAGATVSTSTAQLGVNAVQIGAAVPGSATIGTVTTTTTATNLTNAPTAGDFTAAMKTSLNAATPASVTGAVASVTGNVGGNVVGSVASVTAGVTVTTNNDKTGYTLTNPGANPTGSVVADGGNSATTFVTDRTETVDNYWNDALLLITSGVLTGQVKKITGYSGTTKAVTVLTGFTAAPATSVTFQLVNR